MRQTVNGRKANAERKKTGQLDLTDPNQRRLLAQRRKKLEKGRSQDRPFLFYWRDTENAEGC